MSKLFTFCFLLISTNIFCQGGISISPNGALPAPSAGLDINFSNKGFLMPRLTQGQQDSINAPALGLMIFNTSTNCFMFYTGTFWQSMICTCTSPPALPGDITGISLFCVNQTGVHYSIAPIPTSTSYVWAVPADATIVSGQGSTSIVVNFGVSGGNVSVYAVNTCGSGFSKSMSVQPVGTVPAKPAAIGGLGYATLNQTGVNSAIIPVATSVYYTWTVPSGAVITSGQGTDSVVVNFGTSSGNICVTDTNICGYGVTECMAINISNSCPAHGSASFIYAGSQSYTIPACVSNITLDVYGAQGGSATPPQTDTGGFGGYAHGTINVTPGSTIYINVGEQPTTNAGGFNGGGNGAANGKGGGGASDVRIGGNDLGSRVIVAGGGGGVPTSWTCTGGTGGGTNGGKGTSSNGVNFNGSGGTQGSGGAGESVYGSGGAGSYGQGGNAGTANNNGGGGGGGYYGGGGGDAGGGGGGSGYTGGVSGGTMQSGVQGGNGQVIVSW